MQRKSQHCVTYFHLFSHVVEDPWPHEDTPNLQSHWHVKRKVQTYSGVALGRLVESNKYLFNSFPFWSFSKASEKVTRSFTSMLGTLIIFIIILSTFSYLGSKLTTNYSRCFDKVCRSEYIVFLQQTASDLLVADPSTDRWVQIGRVHMSCTGLGQHQVWKLKHRALPRRSNNWILYARNSRRRYTQKIYFFPCCN